MAPPNHARPPGAPRKMGQAQMYTDSHRDRLSTSSSSTAGDQSSTSGGSLYPSGEPSSGALFTVPRLPSDRVDQTRRDASGITIDQRIGAGNWLSRRMPGHQQREHDPSTFIDTPSGNNQQTTNTYAGQGAAAMSTPSIGGPSTSRLYQDLTRGIANSRRGRTNSRISAASSGWGSPKLNIGHGGRHITAAPVAEINTIYGSATPGPSRLPHKTPTGIFDTPRTPSGENAHPSTQRLNGHHHGVNGSAVPTPVNIDGSLSVVRNEEEANNSGLLGMSPAIRRIQGLGLGMTPAIANLNGAPIASPLSKQQQSDQKVFSPDPTGMIANQSVIEHSMAQDSSSGTGDIDAFRARLDEYDLPRSDERSALLDVMRNWREDAMKHHLYETAIYWGDKILNMETHQIAWNDAYNLATAYFLTHRYAQAEQLLCTPLRLAKRSVQSSSEDVDILPEDEIKQAAGDQEWEDLEAAVNATRQTSSLPASMLAKMNGIGGTAEDLESKERKRKERPFTISGTGTGSEGTGGGRSGESASNVDEAVAPVLMGGPKLTEEDAVMSAWREEQNVAMEEIRERDLPPPDSVSLVSISIPCKYLAAQCMVRQEKYQEALDELSGWKNESAEQLQESYHQPSRDGLIKLSSSIWHLKGLIHLKLRNTDEAKEDFIKSLSLDVKNYESFDQLIRGNLLTSSEQWGLIEGLQFVSQ